jgi:hypothetical protein
MANVDACGRQGFPPAILDAVIVAMIFGIGIRHTAGGDCLASGCHDTRSRQQIGLCGAFLIVPELAI